MVKYPKKVADIFYVRFIRKLSVSPFRLRNNEPGQVSGKDFVAIQRACLFSTGNVKFCLAMEIFHLATPYSFSVNQLFLVS